MRAVHILAASVLIWMSAANAHAGDKGPRRLAYVGLLRGPMAPARAEALEQLLIDELDGYETFRLVDAGGNALDERLLGYEASRAAKLIDEGVDHLLHFQYKKAIERLDKAIEVFETRLTSLRDQEILHEALLAKAEALDQSGKPSAALETLKQLASLTPKKVPTKKTHPPKFVALWERAQKELGSAGRIAIDADEPAPILLLDGKHLGVAPQTATKVSAGKHYVVARWPFFVMSQAVQVSPNREVKVMIAREGPAEKARESFLDVIAQRQGIDNAQAAAKRVIDLAGAEEVVVAAIESQGGAQSLLIAKHDQEGKIDVVARVPLQDSVDSDSLSSTVRRLGAAFFVDKQNGEIELTKEGDVRPSSGQWIAIYGRGGGAALARAEPIDEKAAAKIDEKKERDKEKVPSEDEGTRSKTGKTSKLADSTIERERAERDKSTIVDHEPVDGEDRPIVKQWWFWAGVGAAIVAVAVIGGSQLLRPGPSSTTFEVNLR